MHRALSESPSSSHVPHLCSVGFIGVVVSALFCLAVSKLFGAVDEILKNQKKIIIMLDNLSE